MLTAEEARVDVTVAVTGEHSADELRRLRSWLADDEDLAGLVVPVLPAVPVAPQAPVNPEGLVMPTAPTVPAAPTDAADHDARATNGPPALVVTLTERADGAALAHALVAWILDHTHDAGYEVARPDGVSVRLRAKRVRETGGAMVRELMAELCRTLGHDTAAAQPPLDDNSGPFDEHPRASGE